MDLQTAFEHFQHVFTARQSTIKALTQNFLKGYDKIVESDSPEIDDYRDEVGNKLYVLTTALTKKNEVFFTKSTVEVGDFLKRYKRKQLMVYMFTLVTADDEIDHRVLVLKDDCEQKKKTIKVSIKRVVVKL